MAGNDMVSAVLFARSPALTAAPASRRAYAASVAREAVRALYAELALYPKPGLVSFVDNGSHKDMNAATFMRSLFSLRRYFHAMTLAGCAAAPFAELKHLAIDAEDRMLRATRGINTHRGAIFCLGMLCAAAGHGHARGTARTADALRSTLLIEWGEALAAHAQAGTAASSHGQEAVRKYGASGAREEAACGFPSVFEVGLPALRGALAQGRAMRLARIDALFALMAQLSDTNVLHRGGPSAAGFVRTAAQAFVSRGGTAAGDWLAEALRCHHAFVARKISPGGAADLLAASCLVDALTR
jgi:triphosphoribosyl-dephospho-CoA synthase